MLVAQPDSLVIGVYRQLWRIEKIFWMSVHDPQARPIHHHTREPTQAPMTIVFAAMAVGQYVQHQIDWRI
jgi:hypothetical protein